MHARTHACCSVPASLRSDVARQNSRKNFTRGLRVTSGAKFRSNFGGGSEGGTGHRHLVNGKYIDLEEGIGVSFFFYFIIISFFKYLDKVREQFSRLVIQKTDRACFRLN